MKTLKAIVILILVSVFSTTTYAAEVPRESAPCHTTTEAIITAETLIGEVLTEVQNGLGYADARAKSNRIIFDAFINGQTNGFSYGELVDIANGAIFHYRNAYLRPNSYDENVGRISNIIGSVIEDYKVGKITYTEAEFNARVKIYQSINPSFNPDIEFAKDPIYRDIPSVDNSLFAIARKLILESK